MSLITHCCIWSDPPCNDCSSFFLCCAWPLNWCLQLYLHLDLNFKSKERSCSYILKCAFEKFLIQGASGPSWASDFPEPEYWGFHKHPYDPRFVGVRRGRGTTTVVKLSKMKIKNGGFAMPMDGDNHSKNLNKNKNGQLTPLDHLGYSSYK